MTDHEVAKVGDIAPGKSKVVAVGDREIAVFNITGQYFAIENMCLHRAGPVGEGDVAGNEVTCPLHGWTYDVRTGALTTNPRMKLPTFPTKVEGDSVKVVV